MPTKRLSIDIHRKQVGRLYAKAYIGAALDAGELDERMEELESLVHDVFDRFPELEEMLSGAMLVHKDRIAKLDEIFGRQASPMMLNFLKVLSAHDRLDCIRHILEEAHHQINVMRNRVEALVRVARPLADADQRSITARLEQLLGKQIEMTVEVDPSLIGGVLIQVGDQVFDGSVRFQFDRLRGQMVDRGVQQIVERQGRFTFDAP